MTEKVIFGSTPPPYALPPLPSPPLLGSLLTTRTCILNMADGTSDELYGSQKDPSGRVDFVREEFKRYKRKKPPPDFSEVIDFQDPSRFRGRVEKFEVNKNVHSKFGLRCSTEWRAYKLKSCPGFMFIVNPFVPGAQHYWTRRCMEDFPRKPNVCNLDAHVTLDPNKSVWELR